MPTYLCRLVCFVLLGPDQGALGCIDHISDANCATNNILQQINALVW